MPYWIHAAGFVLETGAIAILLQLLDEILVRLPFAWYAALSITLPIALILGLRRAAGEPWQPLDLGLAVRVNIDWAETLWLLLLQTSVLLAALLYLGQRHYHDLLDFLGFACRKLTGRTEPYAPFMAALALTFLLRHGWVGELLHRGYIQGLGTIRFGAAVGGFIAWIATGATAGASMFRLGSGGILVPALIGLAIIFPGPLFEAYYVRNRTILPLAAVRALSAIGAFSGGGLYLYWHPDRAFALAAPLLALTSSALLLLSIIAAGRLRGLWWTALGIVESGAARGAAPALALGALLAADSARGTPGVRTAFCVASITAVLLRAGRGQGSRSHPQ